MNLGQPLAILALSFATSAFGQAAFSVENKKPEKPIVGQPFSADQVIRTVQHLTNGVTLTKQMTGHIYRSSAGLERSEATPDSTDPEATKPVTLAWIVDRTEHTAVLVHVQSKFATITHLPPDSTVHFGFLVQPGDNLPEQFRPGKAETAELGQRIQDGLVMVGKRVTRTIPYDKAGNDAPLLSSKESWYSSQLNLVVEEVERDPADGERTVELTNVRREEPDPELFKISPGFKIMDQPLVPPKTPRPAATP